MQKTYLSKLTLLFSMMILLFSAHGQYAAIPDSNFGTWLNNNGYSLCMTGNNTSGWQIDTTNNTVLSTASIMCNNAGIHDLTGLGYFKNLTCLYCTDNQLTSLPPLPLHLDTLTCFDNMLTSLPPLPGTLFRLDCDYNQLTSIPVLPVGLSWINCSNNPLMTLPALPAGLYGINCSDDSLTYLPDLPSSLVELFCFDNQLSGLPILPPLLTSIDCHNNPNLSCLPFMYQNALLSFYITHTAITCLPNRFEISTYGYSDVSPDTFPLCTFSSGCPFYNNIFGNVHNDTALTCASDSIYPGNPMYNINVLLKQNGQVLQQCYTSLLGQYSFTTQLSQGYTVEVDTAGLPFTVVCPSSDSISVTLSANDTVASGVNFGLQCSLPDYTVAAIWGYPFTPGDTTVVYVIAGNPLLYWFNADCGSSMSGSVVTVLSGPVQYVGPAPGALTPGYVSGDSIVYTISDLDSLVIGSLNILVYTDTSAITDSSVCISASIIPAQPDANPIDDSLTACFAVVSSFDPNHKTVYPTEGLSENGDWLTYTIEFQNTGTAPAATVVIRDTLSSLVQPETFHYIASDHKAVVQVVGNAVKFTFPHINLPDSASDPAKSKGWLKYKVRSKPNLPLQSPIKNTAYIYFDYNAPIVTNTAVSTVNYNTGIASVNGNKIQLYPNPNRGSFTLLTSGLVNSSYVIIDMVGNVINRQKITTESQLINVPNIADGVYTLQVQGSEPLRFTVVR